MAKFDTFETLERPVIAPRVKTGAVAAIRATLDTGKAVFFAANGSRPIEMQMRMGGWRSHFKNEGLRVRTTISDKGVFVWVVRRDDGA